MILQTLLLLGGAPLLTTALRPSESLETLPLAFHSGFADPWPRDAADIAYLARFRLVNLQLWEGPCWNATLAAAARDPPSRGPGPACGAESYQLDTLARVKAANPAVATTFYLNGFFQFPIWSYYAAFDAAPGLLLQQPATNGSSSSSSTVPMGWANDNGLPNITAGDWAQPAARAVWLAAAAAAVAHPAVDGIFVDKLSEVPQQEPSTSTSASRRGSGDGSSNNNRVAVSAAAAAEAAAAAAAAAARPWQLCNPPLGSSSAALRRCFNFSSAMAAAAWQAGQLTMLTELAHDIVPPGEPLGGATMPNAAPAQLNTVIATLATATLGAWLSSAARMASLKADAHNTSGLQLQFYVYNGCYGGGTGTRQHYDTESAVARFLLGVFPGALLVPTGCGEGQRIDGAWFDAKLGSPTGAAVEVPAGVWTRRFAHGAVARFFEVNDTGVVVGLV